MLRPFARSTLRGSENFAVVADQNKWNDPGSMSHRQSDRRLTEVGGRGDYFARNLAKQIGRVPSFVTPDEEPSHAERSGRLVFFPVQSLSAGLKWNAGLRQCGWATIAVACRTGTDRSGSRLGG